MRDDVRQLIETLRLAPHPEGGYFRELHRSTIEVERPGAGASGPVRRSAGTGIYYLLEAGDFSALHRVRGADETWHLYAGGPLELHLIDDAGAMSLHILSTDFAAGAPVMTVPAGCWQAARVAAGAPYALAGCTVYPGFDFADFDMPPAADLVARFPHHAAAIEALTRR